MFLQLFQSCFINKFQNIEMNGKNRIFTNRKTIYRKLYVNIVAQMNVFMTRISFIVITVFTLLFMTFDFAGAQISAPGSSGSEKTNYPDFNETDPIATTGINLDFDCFLDGIEDGVSVKVIFSIA